MKTIKANLNSIIICLCEVLVGILLLINPVGFTTGIIVILGCVFLVKGIFDIIGYFRTDAQTAVSTKGLAKGLIGIAAGGFCILQSHWFLVAFPVLTVLYGIAIFALGLFKVQVMVDMIRLKKKKWGLAALSAVFTLLFGVIALMNPFSTTVILWTFIAATLIVEAVLDLISTFISGQSAND